MESSLVSLMMPCFIRDFKNLEFFKQALDSALAQEYPNLEILVINDGSPLTAEVESLPHLRDRRVRRLNKKNGGVASALNLGLHEMRGEFFTWLSHDDLYLPGKVKEQMNAARSGGPGLVYYCDVEHIDPDNRHLSFEVTPEIRPAEQHLYFAKYGCFNANSYLIPRRCFEVAGQFDESLRTTQDNHMWIRMARHFTSVRVPKVLIKYRHHPTQDSRSPIHVGECNDLYTYFLQNVRREEILDLGLSPARYYAECANLRAARGYRRAQNYALRLALREAARSPWRERKTLNFIIGMLLRESASGRWLHERLAANAGPLPARTGAN
jgi:glycosyltransferase involved in cell wall biosynthesis